MTLLERIRKFFRGENAETFSREALLQAIKDAADEGDTATIEAVSKLVNKKMKEEADAAELAQAEKDAAQAESVEAALPVVDEQQAPTQDDAEQLPQLPAELSTMLETQYPGYTLVSYSEGSLTITLADGTEMMLTVTQNEDGTWSIADAMPSVETEELAQPQQLSKQVKATHPIIVTLDASGMQGTSTWVNIVNLGEYVHDEYGTIEFNREMFDSWSKNLANGVMGGKGADGKPCLAVDYSHAMDSDTASPEQHKAAGYIKQLKLEQDGDVERVFAFIEFTPVAAQGIKNKEWSWFSVSVVANLTDQKTGDDVGHTLMGGAITNRPFVPNLQPIQLSDLRPSKAMTLAKELAKERADRQTAETKLFENSLAASLSALEKEGIPMYVINLARPLLEADRGAATLTFSLGGSKQTLKPGELVQKILLEFHKVGKVPQGEKTGQGDYSQKTLEQASEEVRAEWIKAGRNPRDREVILEARQRNPHLQQSSNQE
jgi:phage I-like protein